ncbi:MAG: hypothetical protein P9L97_03795 [Candidatus Tenebribacter davisii]|nr:hypothetical protein [Candidatus Tenebribacter davisii]
MNVEGIQELVNYIEANLRSSKTAGLNFVDSRNYSSRLTNKQNHVIFGRRGSGKTSLLNSIIENKSIFNIFINLEDFKDITFPNILLYILMTTFNELLKEINSKFPWFKFSKKANKLKKEIKFISKEFKKYLDEPDEETQNINTVESDGLSYNAGFKMDQANVGTKCNKDFSQEIRRKISKKKIDFIRIQLTNYKNLIINISDLFTLPIFLILDDFYFVDKTIQPELVDYFHRLTKSTNLYLKLATIKHRSKLYKRDNKKYIGTELGHDIFDIDIDYTLDDFDQLQTFMKQLLDNAIQNSKCNIIFEQLFTGDGFSQLCLASGGVPRDLLFLFVNLANNINTQNKIGKIQVNEAAISNLADKLDSLKKDSKDDESILENYLYVIKSLVYNSNKTNAFLIAKDDFDKHHYFKQIIRELIDLRLIHLVEQNTSKAPSDGRRYEAFILDICLYDNSRPLNFRQIQPGQRDEKSRRDKLRASPVIEFSKIKSFIYDNGSLQTSNKFSDKEVTKQMTLSFE